MSGNRTGTVCLFQSGKMVALDGTGVAFTLGSSASVYSVPYLEGVRFDDLANVYARAVVKSELSEYAFAGDIRFCKVTLQGFGNLFCAMSPKPT